MPCLPHSLRGAAGGKGQRLISFNTVSSQGVSERQHLKNMMQSGRSQSGMATYCGILWIGVSSMGRVTNSKRTRGCLELQGVGVTFWGDEMF